MKELSVIIKADVQGSIEAMGEALKKLATGAVKVNILHDAVGGITETDVNLASASNAIIIGFNVRPSPKAQSLAEQEHVTCGPIPSFTMRSPISKRRWKDCWSPFTKNISWGGHRSSSSLAFVKWGRSRAV